MTDRLRGLLAHTPTAVILATTGLVLFTLAYATNSRLLRSGAVVFSDTELERRELSIHRTAPSPILAYPGMHLNSETHVTYNPRMRENQNQTVTIRYSVKPPPRYSSTAPLGDITVPSLSVTLASDDFAITPSETHRTKGNDNLPFQFPFMWLISPKSEGDYALYVDFSGLEWEPDRGGTVELFTINGKTEELSEWRKLIIPITVTTYLDLSRKTVFLIISGAQVLAFLLTCPLIVVVTGALWKWIKT